MTRVTLCLVFTVASYQITWIFTSHSKATHTVFWFLISATKERARVKLLVPRVGWRGASQVLPVCPRVLEMQANLVSRAFRGLFRGCCSKQLTAGLPATGTVIALSTREVMACTARTLIWVLSVSSWKDSKHVIKSQATRHQQPPVPPHAHRPEVHGSQSTRPYGKEP